MRQQFLIWIAVFFLILVDVAGESQPRAREVLAPPVPLLGVPRDYAAVPVCQGRHLIPHEEQSFNLPYCANRPLEEPALEVELALVAIHSSDWDAEAYLEHLESAVRDDSLQSQALLLLAPQFMESGVIRGPVERDLLYWRINPARGSQRAEAGGEGGARKVRLSAFEALDHLLESICADGNYPSLRDVVLLGHSAGGQLVQRYALSSPVPDVVSRRCGYRIRYLVMAPSSYAYLTDHRWNPPEDGVESRFEPYRGSCEGFNNWGYGLKGLYAYHRRAGVNAETMRAHIATRRIRYLVGDLDAHRDDPSLGTGCAAQLQGPDRRTRARLFVAQLEQLFGKQIRSLHDLFVIPETGHSGRALIRSQPGRDFLFQPRGQPVSRESRYAF